MQSYIKLRGGSLRAIIRLSAYYIQRLVVSQFLRKISTKTLIHILGALYPARRPLQRNLEQAKELREVGYLALGRVLTNAQCDEIRTHLSDHTLIDSRGNGNHFRLSSPPAGTKLGDYTLETVVTCPHILELANRADFTALAAEYLGFTPLITNISLRWSFPTDSPAGEVQKFHRDSEIASFKILIYLTDVDVGSGPHLYITRTHQERMPLRLKLYSDQEVLSKYGRGVTITGPAGTAFAIDPKGIHKGVVPTSRPRLLLGIQYSLLPCLLHDYAPVQHPSALTFDTYINRLVVSPHPLKRAPGYLA